MYHIDVGGTQNVLEAAEGAGVQQVLVTSSATAYGAFPDNPVPMTEEHPVRGVPDFEYARDKAESDRLCQLWALRTPEAHDDDRAPLHRARAERGQLHRAPLDRPALPADSSPATTPMPVRPRGRPRRRDLLLLDERHDGAFNIAGDGTITSASAATRRRQEAEGPAEAGVAASRG